MKCPVSVMMTCLTCLIIASDVTDDDGDDKVSRKCADDVSLDNEVSCKSENERGEALFAMMMMKRNRSLRRS